MTPRIETVPNRIPDGFELLFVEGARYGLLPSLLVEGLNMGIRIEKPLGGLVKLTMIFEDIAGHWVEIANVALTENDIPYLMNVVVSGT